MSRGNLKFLPDGLVKIFTSFTGKFSTPLLSATASLRLLNSGESLSTLMFSGTICRLSCLSVLNSATATLRLLISGVVTSSSSNTAPKLKFLPDGLVEIFTSFTGKFCAPLISATATPRLLGSGESLSLLMVLGTL